MRNFFTLIISGLVFSQLSAQISTSGTDASQEANKVIILPGIDTGSDIAQIRLYPNPIVDLVHIRFSEKMIGNSIRIYSLIGSEVADRSITNSQEVIDLTGLPSGLYIYSIIDKNRKTITSGKFNKQ